VADELRPDAESGVVEREGSVTPVASSLPAPHTMSETPSRQIPIELVINPSTPSAPPQTPVRDVSAQFGAIGEQATPISALLSSIQRGFLFTPATPLSPPDSYLPKEAGAVPVMPFPLFSNRPPRVDAVESGAEVEGDHKYNDEWKQTRQALEAMDIN